MARARGSIEHRRKLAERPHVVECPAPGSGLGSRYDAMSAWCRERCGADGFVTSMRVDRAPDRTPLEILLVHFRDEATAGAFAQAFGLMRPPERAPGRHRAAT
jgi:hypothetical protein